MDDNKPFIVAIVILVLLLLGLGGYVFYDKFVLEQKNVSSKMIVDDSEFDLNSMYQVTDIIDRLDLAFNDCSSTYCGYIYNQKKIIIDNFNQEAALYASLAYEFSRTGTLQYAYGVRVKNNYLKVFGKNVEYNPPAQLSAGENYQIVYDANSGNYSYIVPVQVPYQAGYSAYNIKTNITKEGIEITRKVFFVEYVSKDNGASYSSINIYKDHSKNQKIGTLALKDGSMNPREVVDKFGSKCKSYVYKFSENNMSNYSLTRIEAV